MLLHLPIVMLATFSPSTISDTVPRFDIAKECRFESESPGTFNRCSRDEADALQQLEKEWPQFVGADRSTCVAEATAAGLASYVELQICLEMARDVGNGRANPGGPPGADSTDPREMNVVGKQQ